MSDIGKVLAQVYELILGRELMNSLVEISQQDETIAVKIMGVAVKAKFGNMPFEEAVQKMTHLVAELKRAQESSS